MTKAQIKLVSIWAIIGYVLYQLSQHDEWIIEYWGILQIPMAIALFITAEIEKKKNPNKNVAAEIIKKHPWVLLYFAACALCSLGFLFYVLFTGIMPSDFIGLFELIIIFFAIMLPFYVIWQFNLFITAGKKPNK